MRLWDLIRLFVTPKSILGAIVLAMLLFGMTALTVWIARPGPTTLAPATAVLQVIPLPSPTPILPTPTPMELTPTLDVPPPPPPGVIGVGAYVQISGTGGDGLRMRREPGLNGEVLFLGLEAEVFLVIEGPQPVDGYTWWLLSAPYDENVRGWAVANFLSVVQNP